MLTGEIQALELLAEIWDSGRTYKKGSLESAIVRGKKHCADDLRRYIQTVKMRKEVE